MGIFSPVPYCDSISTTHGNIFRYYRAQKNFNLKDDPEELDDIYHDMKDFEEVIQLNEKMNLFYKKYSTEKFSGLNVKNLPRHNYGHVAWRPNL